MNVLLVHGTVGKPFENWFPWLEHELDKLHINCLIPTFPTPDHQNYSDWEKLMDYYCEMGLINSETILVGHSCGSVFLSHYLLTHQIRVFCFISVSGYNHFCSGDELMDSLNSSFYFKEDNCNFSMKAEKIVAFYSDNDPFIPQHYLRKFAQLINAEEIIIPNAGHFNTASGYSTFPQILNYITELVEE